MQLLVLAGRDYSGVVIRARGVEKRYGDKRVLRGVRFDLARDGFLLVTGPNGSGKTTLLETLLGRRPPVSGTVRLGHGVEAAYFSQHEVELDERGSVLQATQGATGLQRPDAQNLLGRFLFSGWDEHEKPVAALSGGERRRLALALVVASGANFLVLEEPTNHLDLESREALEAALDAFPGTVLLVSHDRALLDGIAERTLAIEHGTLDSYDGGWAEYTRRREQVDAPAPSPDPEPKKAKPRPAKPRPKRATELERIETQIAEGEERVADLERQLADDWSDMAKLSAHRKARDELQALLERWEQLFERSQA